MKRKTLNKFPNASWILAAFCFIVFLILFAITQKQWARHMSLYTGLLTLWFMVWRILNMKLDKIRALTILKYLNKYDKN